MFNLSNSALSSAEEIGLGQTDRQTDMERQDGQTEIEDSFTNEAIKYCSSIKSLMMAGKFCYNDYYLYWQSYFRTTSEKD